MKHTKLLGFVIFITAIIGACGKTSGELTVNNIWARPALAGNNGAVYFVIENGTSTSDTLLSASTNIASAAEVHMSMEDTNGVMSMQMQEAISIPAKGKVEFKTGGLHIMLIGLTKDLNPGDTFTLMLNFEKAGEIALQVDVKDQP